VRAAPDGEEAPAAPGGRVPGRIILDTLLPIGEAGRFRAGQRTQAASAEVSVHVPSAGRDLAAKTRAFEREAMIAEPLGRDDRLRTIGRVVGPRED
jgi:hypothetical protein